MMLPIQAVKVAFVTELIKCISVVHFASSTSEPLMLCMKSSGFTSYSSSSAIKCRFLCLVLRFVFPSSPGAFCCAGMLLMQWCWPLIMPRGTTPLTSLPRSQVNSGKESNDPNKPTTPSHGLKVVAQQRLVGGWCYVWMKPDNPLLSRTCPDLWDVGIEWWKCCH